MSNYIVTVVAGGNVFVGAKVAVEFNDAAAKIALTHTEYMISINEINHDKLDNRFKELQTLDNAKPPIFWKDKPIILKQLQKCSKEKIEEILIKIAETEVLMKKNSYLRNDVVMKNLIINLTNKISTIS